MPKILIVGGGYAGFYTAWKLEKWLRRGEAEVDVVDPLPYMTYQPFLPEVAAGSIEPRHAVVAHRRHLKRTTVIAAEVTAIDHAHRDGDDHARVGEPCDHDYDMIVVTAGAVSRTFPIPGVADEAIGLKTIEEAVAIRDRLITNFDKASELPAGPGARPAAHLRGRRRRLRRHRGLRRAALARDRAAVALPELTFDDTHFHLIEAMGRIMPEVSLRTSELGAQEPRRARRAGAPRHPADAAPSAATSSCRRARPSSPTSSSGPPASWPTPMVRQHRPAGRGARPPARARRPARRQRRGRSSRTPGARATSRAVPDLTGGGVGGFCVPERPARRAPGQAPREEPRRRPARRGRRRTTSTRTSARSRASASTTACSSPARSRQGLPRLARCTAATTASRCPRGSARSASSSAGCSTSSSAATWSLEAAQHPRAAFEAFAARTPNGEVPAARRTPSASARMPTRRPRSHGNVVKPSDVRPRAGGRRSRARWSAAPRRRRTGRSGSPPRRAASTASAPRVRAAP